MKKVLPIILAALLIGAGIVLFTSQDKDKQPTSTDTTDMTAMDMPANSDQPSTAQVQPISTNAVTIKDMAFAPGDITIKKGTTVTWTNQDTVGHDVTPVKPTSEFKQSEMLSKGESYSVTFNTVGTFAYFCTPHPFMKAQVTVTE